MNILTGSMRAYSARDAEKAAQYADEGEELFQVVRKTSPKERPEEVSSKEYYLVSAPCLIAAMGCVLDLLEDQYVGDWVHVIEGVEP